MGIYTKFYFKPGKGEQISTEVRPERDDAAAVCGRVTDARGKPVEGAVALLFRPGEGGEPALLDRTRTDSDGHFIFGPLEGEVLYLVKIYKSGGKMRVLEIKAE